MRYRIIFGWHGGKNAKMGKSKTAKKGGAKGTRKAAGWDKRMEKKLDRMCLLASAVIIAITAALELRDRRGR